MWLLYIGIAVCLVYLYAIAVEEKTLEAEHESRRT